MKPTIADKIRHKPDPYRASVAAMTYRASETFRVLFYFADGSMLSFRKEYHLED